MSLRRPDRALEAWVLRRREVHYDARPRRRFRVWWFDLVAGVVWGHLELWEVRMELGLDDEGRPMNEAG